MYIVHWQQYLAIVECSHLEERGNEGGGPDGPVEVEVVLTVPPVSYTHLTLPTNREV